MTALRFYGGVNEIGGNKFLLEDREGRVFLDFGRNFAREKRFFDEPWITARKEDHLLALGILPNLDGLYRSDADHPAAFDGVLVSHPHTDHYDAVHWLKEDIPIYASPQARSLILARDFSGRARGGKEYYLANWTKSVGREVYRPITEAESGRAFEVAGLSATAHEVDHSVQGAVGYVVETSEGNIVYTGDFRLHGPRGDQTRAFLEAAREAEPEALLIEGTHVDQCRVESEVEVEQKVRRIVERTEGLVVAGFAVADLDRLTTFYEVARATDRTLVMTRKQAFFVDQLAAAGQFEGFDLRDPNVLIFAKKKKTSHAWENHLDEEYGGHVVEAADVRGMQEEAILVASLTDMLALPAIDPMPGSVYVLSQSEPWDEEMEISYDKLLGWLTQYGLPLFQVHASGHASAHELREAVETVQPRRVFLIHTANAPLYARFLEKLGFDVVPPDEGRAYEL